MRPLLWILLPAIVVVLGSFAYWQYCIVPIVHGDITAAFAADVSGFVSKHEGRLPSDWNEFATWMKSDMSSTRWKASELEERFQLKIPEQRQTPDVPTYIEVIDPDLKNMQDYINRLVHNAIKS